MAASQTVLFTIIPRGISVNSKSMPVSVIVSPRLSGEDYLGAFPDWLNWTERLREGGLVFELQCNKKTTKISVDTEMLRPELWEQLFNAKTLVRPREFDDYTEHGIISYSVRNTLSALKTIYQRAGIDLALPEDGDGPSDEKEREGNRDRLSDLINGLEVNWNKDNAKTWREVVRSSHKANFGTAARLGNPLQAFDGPLDEEGLYITDPDPVAFKKTAIPFSVFHHMPTPDRNDHELCLDTENLLDFHQVLSSLNAYPELQRALGLVFDLELPHGFVKKTAPGKFGTLSVVNANLDWEIAPKTPDLETAYVHLDIANLHLFLRHRGY